MIYARPGVDYEATCQADTGLTGTIAVRVIDNEGATVTTRATTGVTEYPASSGIYSVTLTAPDDSGQYSVVWDDGAGSFSAPEELFVAERFLTPIGGVGGAYATVEELAAILKVNAVTKEEQLQRVLEAAAFEIDSELGRAEAFTSVPALVIEVNLERAVEHWQQMQSPFGIIGLGGDLGATHVARDSWDRHAHKLAPLKETWGVA